MGEREREMRERAPPLPTHPPPYTPSATFSPPTPPLHTSSLSLIGGTCVQHPSAFRYFPPPAHLLSLSYRGQVCTLPVRYFSPPAHLLSLSLIGGTCAQLQGSLDHYQKRGGEGVEWYRT